MRLGLQRSGVGVPAQTVAALGSEASGVGSAQRTKLVPSVRQSWVRSPLMTSFAYMESVALVSDWSSVIDSQRSPR